MMTLLIYLSQELDISGWKSLTELEQVLDIVIAFPNLKYLNLSNCPVISQNKTELFEILTSSSALVIETEKDSSLLYPIVSDQLTTVPQSTSDHSYNIPSSSFSAKGDQNVSGISLSFISHFSLWIISFVSKQIRNIPLLSL
jgi:hypothetical protein